MAILWEYSHCKMRTGMSRLYGWVSMELGRRVASHLRHSPLMDVLLHSDVYFIGLHEVYDDGS